MRFAKKEVMMKDGRKCILQPTGPEAAAEMIEYMKQTAAETPYLLRYPQGLRSCDLS